MDWRGVQIKSVNSQKIAYLPTIHILSIRIQVSELYGRPTFSLCTISIKIDTYIDTNFRIDTYFDTDNYIITDSYIDTRKRIAILF